MSLPSRPYIEAAVDSRIHILKVIYPEYTQKSIVDDKKVADAITSALTLPNLDKAKAIRLGQRGAQRMPDFLPFYKWHSNKITLPRGYAHQLERLMHRHGYDIQWDDRRVDVLMDPEYASRMKQIIPYDYQEPMVEVITRSQQGILKEPPSCVAWDTQLQLNRAGKGFKTTIEKAYKKFHNLGGRGPAWDKSITTYCKAVVDGVLRQHEVEDIVYSGVKDTIEIELQSGKKLRCTREHRILTSHGWKNAGNLRVEDEVMTNGMPIGPCQECGKIKKLAVGNKYQPTKFPGWCLSCIQRHIKPPMRYMNKDGYIYVRSPVGHPRGSRHGIREHILIIEQTLERSIDRTEHVHHKNKIPFDNNPDNLQALTPGEHHRIHDHYLNMDGGTAANGGQIIFVPRKDQVKSVVYVGPCKTYDMIMKDPHNNFVANGIVVHNSGKTVVTLEAIRRLGQRALILIHKKEIAAQWQDRCNEFLKVPMGFIGDGKWDEQEITVALIQTLTSRKDQLQAENFYAQWGTVVLDEGHGSTSNTRIDALQHFPARTLFGLSATPGKQDLRIAEIMLGPAMQPLSQEDMYKQGILIRPKIFGVVTNYWAPSNRRYASMEKELIDDPQRNQLIASKIIDQEGSCQLVVSRRLKQLHILKGLCEEAGMERLFMLTGAQKLKERQEIIHDAQDNGNCVIFSTLADEALDIPMADRLHLAFPVSKPDLLIQIIGRIQRRHKNTTSVVVYDYRDLPGPMTKQWQNRLLEVYRPSGWPVETIRST